MIPVLIGVLAGLGIFAAGFAAGALWERDSWAGKLERLHDEWLDEHERKIGALGGAGGFLMGSDGKRRRVFRRG